MNPNLMYAQAVQGRSTGRNYGIIDTLHIVEVARAAAFLVGELLNEQESEAVRGWFAIYLEWLCRSEGGQQERPLPSAAHLPRADAHQLRRLPPLDLPSRGP